MLQVGNIQNRQVRSVPLVKRFNKFFAYTTLMFFEWKLIMQNFRPEQLNRSKILAFKSVYLLLLLSILISGTALLNICAQFKVLLDIPSTQLCKSRDVKQKFKRIKIKCVPNDSSCSTKMNIRNICLFCLWVEIWAFLCRGNWKNVQETARLLKKKSIKLNVSAVLCTAELFTYC